MIFDIVVIVSILVSCLIAFLRGFIRETLTILGVIGGILAAVALGPAMSPVVRGWFGAPDVEGEPEGRLFDLIPYDVAADVIAYGGIFVVVVIILSVISHYLAGFAKAIGLGAVDRTFGVIFGVVRAVILLALLYLPVYLLVEEDTRREWFGDSRTRMYVESTSDWIAGYLPQSVTDETEAGINGVTDATRNKLKEMEMLAPGPRRQSPPDQRPVPENQPGYGEDQRDVMDDLFRQQTTEGQQ